MMRKVLGILLLVTSITTPAFAEREKPFNRVVVIIDSSGTFKNHQPAIEKVRKLLEEMAKRKERRYEVSDDIYIISLDARPEVIWAGKRNHLGQLTKERLSELFRDRMRYIHCTDIATAFNLAVHKLNREPIPSDKWLFVFSDLIDEPEVSSGKCKAPVIPSLPSEKIRWDRLTDTSIGVFWAPDPQIMAWEDALADKRLSIKFYNEAEALNVNLPPPPKAQREMTEEEKAEAKERISGWLEWGKAIGLKLFLGFIIFMGLVILLAFLSRHRSRSHIVNK
jgi:hypothetical protein